MTKRNSFKRKTMEENCAAQMLPTQDHLSPTLQLRKDKSSQLPLESNCRQTRLIQKLIAYRPQIDRTHQRFYDCTKTSQRAASNFRTLTRGLHKQTRDFKRTNSAEFVKEKRDSFRFDKSCTAAARSLASSQSSQRQTGQTIYEEIAESVSNDFGDELFKSSAAKLIGRASTGKKASTKPKPATSKSTRIKSKLKTDATTTQNRSLSTEEHSERDIPSFRDFSLEAPRTNQSSLCTFVKAIDHALPSKETPTQSPNGKKGPYAQTDVREARRPSKNTRTIFRNIQGRKADDGSYPQAMRRQVLVKRGRPLLFKSARVTFRGELAGASQETSINDGRQISPLEDSDRTDLADFSNELNCHEHMF